MTKRNNFERRFDRSLVETWKILKRTERLERHVARALRTKSVSNEIHNNEGNIRRIRFSKLQDDCSTMTNSRCVCNHLLS